MSRPSFEEVSADGERIVTAFIVLLFGQILGTYLLVTNQSDWSAALGLVIFLFNPWHLLLKMDRKEAEHADPVRELAEAR